MDTQTCSVCGAIGNRLSFSPVSGWDWYRDARLCPKHALSHYHLIEAAMKADQDAAERTRKAVLAVPCPYCHAKVGERCQSPTKGTRYAVPHTSRESTPLESPRIWGT